MTCCLPPEQILFSSASLIGTDKCKLMLFYIPHMTAYSLAAALLMCSWLLSGRTTDRSSSTHPQLMPATVSLCRAIALFNLRARSSYERRPVTCPGNWSTMLIPVNYVSFLGPKEIAEYDVFFLTAAGTFVSGCWHLPPPHPHWMFPFSWLSQLLTMTDRNPACERGVATHSRADWPGKSAYSM